MTELDYQDNLCLDTPDSRDYSAEDYQEVAMGIEWKKRPEDKVEVQNQGKEWACTRFWLTHVNNGQNIIEYEANWSEYTQIKAIDVWNRSNKVLSLQSALAQFKTEWLIEGWVRIDRYPSDKAKAIIQMKQAIDMWNFVYTWSESWDWSKTWKKPYIYQLRTDWKIVGHAWSIVEYDDTTQMFKAINSRWPTRWDKGYFYVPYEMIDKLFSKYCIIDKDNSDIFKNFKRKQKAKELVAMCSDFWKWELNSWTQTMLHNLAEQLRLEYNLSI